MSLFSKDSCLLITSSSHDHAQKSALKLFEKLKNQGYTVYLDTFLAKKKGSPEHSCPDTKVDMIFIFGGDGTILKTFATWKNSPIFGVNCGKVGFLTEIQPEEVDKALVMLENKEYFIEDHYTIDISSENSPTVPAANDAIVTSDKIGHVITLGVHVDDQFLYSLNSDGLIIATSTGSSAYSLSAGGSLIVPSIEAITLVPICPISRSIVPMVFSLESTIKVTNLSEYRSGSVVIDGRTYFSLGYKESIEIKKSSEKISFIRFADNYVPRVREKLLRFNL